MSEALMMVEKFSASLGSNCWHITSPAKITSLRASFRTTKVDVAVQRLRELTGEEPVHVTIPKK